MKKLKIVIIGAGSTDFEQGAIADLVSTEGLKVAIENLPDDAVVEVPSQVDSKGVRPVKVGPLPEAIAGLCQLQVSIQKLLIEAYKEKSKEILSLALAIDPVIDDREKAGEMIKTMLKVEYDHLPELK